MKLIDNIFYYLTVPKCVNCNEKLDKNDRALCKKCKREYDNALMRNCSLCSKPLYECTCSMKYLDAHYVHKVVKVFRYLKGEDLPTNNLIYSLKRDNRKDVLNFLAEELASSIKVSIPNPENCIFTSIPRRRYAIVKYGIDHAQLLAETCAKILGAKYIKTLKSKAKKEQKKEKTKEERFENANFKLKHKKIDINNKRVIIVDDIITSGASMSRCAMLLKQVDAGAIIGAVLSIAYKDDTVFFDTSDRFLPHK